MRTKIFVISLTDALMRRTQFEQTLRDVDLDWEFFDAHRALQGALIYRNEASHPTHGRTLRSGELGCYSSHYATWQWLLDSDYDQIIVFEDDVSVDWNLIAQFTRTNFAEFDINYLRMFAKIPPRWRYVASPFFDRYHHLVRCTSYVLGSQAYMLTRKGAQILVRAGQCVHYPIDAFMDRYWDHGVPNLAIFPFPVFERFVQSSIGEKRFEAESVTSAARLQFRVQRMLIRLRMMREYIGPERASIRALKNRLQGRFEEKFTLAVEAR